MHDHLALGRGSAKSDAEGDGNIVAISNPVRGDYRKVQPRSRSQLNDGGLLLILFFEGYLSLDVGKIPLQNDL